MTELEKQNFEKNLTEKAVKDVAFVFNLFDRDFFRLNKGQREIYMKVYQQGMLRAVREIRKDIL